MLRHLPFAKLNDGLTPFNNLITIFNVFVWQVSTSILYWFTNNVLGIFVTDWWWYARDLDALSPEILGIGPALFFYILESFLWPSGLILFDQNLPSFCVNLATKSLFAKFILLSKLATNATESGLLSLFSDSSILP